MDAHFTIDVDRDLDLVRMVLSGFFRPEDVARLIAARNAAHQTLRCGANQHVTLAGIRTMKIQAQESVSAFSAMLADPTQQSRKLAFVVATSLARAPLTRAASSRAARFFTNMIEARAWLLKGDETTVTRSAA